VVSAALSTTVLLGALAIAGTCLFTLMLWTLLALIRSKDFD